MSAADVGIGIAAASAAASAVSAFESARGVALSHRPIVVGREYREWTKILREQEVGVVGVAIRNEGPGIALNVRYRPRSWEWDLGTTWSSPVGSLRTGEERQDSIPFALVPGLTEVELGLTDPAPGAHAPNYVLWYIETLFSDLRGVNWIVRPDRSYRSNERPRRVRSRKLDLWRPKGAST
jgi:hypothetical protein